MAEMWTLVIKNTSGADVAIDELGITLASGSQLNAYQQFSYTQLASCDQLRDLVAAGTLVINDGATDLSNIKGVDFLKIYNLDQAKRDFYTKTEMGMAGGATIHFDNLTNVPAFGASSWTEPAKARILSISATAPVGPVIGQFYIKTSDNHLYKYDGTGWIDQGAPQTGDQVINLSDATQDIFRFDGTTWTQLPTSQDMSGINIKDDGDGKQAQYVFVEADGSWKKTADVDFGEPNTLDGSYDEGGAGVGRVINADAGAVKIDVGTASNAGLELTEKALLPTTGLAAGQMAVRGGILYMYDSSRNKFLSIEKDNLAFGRSGTSRNQYLGFFGNGAFSSSTSGLRITRNSTITSISSQLSASGTCSFQIRKNDGSVSIASQTITAAEGGHDTSLNIDVVAGDYLQCYISNTNTVSNPMVLIELKYR
jgi:hypothetical protein